MQEQRDAAAAEAAEEAARLRDAAAASAAEAAKLRACLAEAEVGWYELNPFCTRGLKNTWFDKKLDT